jgi:hypothetical protein
VDRYVVTLRWDESRALNVPAFRTYLQGWIASLTGHTLHGHQEWTDVSLDTVQDLCYRLESQGFVRLGVTEPALIAFLRSFEPYHYMMNGAHPVRYECVRCRTSTRRSTNDVRAQLKLAPT